MKYLSTFTFLFLSFWAKSQCPNDPPLILSTFEYEVEDTLIVNIVGFNIDNLVGTQFGITYNTSILEFQSLEQGLLFDSRANEVAPGEIRFLWIEDFPVEPVFLSNGSVLCSFKFLKIQQGDGQIIITDLPGFSIEFTNSFIEILCYQITGQYSILQGNIINDQDNSCGITQGETELTNWQLNLTDTNSGQVYPIVSNSEGDYFVFLQPGDYNFEVTPSNSLWDLCENSFSLNIQNTDTIYIQDFHAQTLLDCPFMQVDVSAPFLRRCFPNFYHVKYCNEGTIPAIDVEIEITLDPYLSLVNSSNPNYNVSGDIVTYFIGDVGVGECGNIQIETYLNCDSTVLGQTHCVSAHIFPDSLCAPIPAEWNGASIQLEGSCDGDSVRFKITNSGLGDMTNPQELIVVEDDVMRNGGDIQLSAGQSIFKSFEATGATYRMIAQQVSNHPGHSKPSLAIEGCDASNTGSFSTGFYTLFPEDEEDSYISIDCQENIGSFDPNDKLASPKGYSEEKWIEKETMLEYMIRFQNTGTDTAFRVVVIDTITEKLDLASINILNTSHPAEVRILGERVISFEFDNIRLVDSTTNEAASHGFIKYAIFPKQDAVEGDIVNNSASIYFDFNEPVLTEVVSRTISENFFDVTSAIIPQSSEIQQKDVLVFPNPVIQNASVKFSERNLPTDLEYAIYSLNGELLLKNEFQTDDKIICEQLNKGVYIIQFRNSGKMFARTKFVVL